MTKLFSEGYQWNMIWNKLPFAKGQYVLLHNLRTQALNEELGTIKDFNVAKGRYAVKLFCRNDPILVKVDNIREAPNYELIQIFANPNAESYKLFNSAQRKLIVELRETLHKLSVMNVEQLFSNISSADVLASYDLLQRVGEFPRPPNGKIDKFWMKLKLDGLMAWATRVRSRSDLFKTFRTKVFDTYEEIMREATAYGFHHLRVSSTAQ